MAQALRRQGRRRREDTCVDGVRLRLQGRLRPVGGESGGLRGVAPRGGLLVRRVHVPRRGRQSLHLGELELPLRPLLRLHPHRAQRQTTTHVHYRVRLTRDRKQGEAIIHIQYYDSSPRRDSRLARAQSSLNGRLKHLKRSLDACVRHLVMRHDPHAPDGARHHQQTHTQAVAFGHERVRGDGHLTHRKIK